MGKSDQISKDEKIFLDFLSTKFIKKNEVTGEYPKPITHTLVGFLHETKPWRGSFHISEKDYNNFLKLYKNVYGKMPLHFVERPNESGNMIGPYIVDIDYHTNSEERLYTQEHVKKVVEICTNVFKKYLDVGDDKLKAYVTEKEKPSFDSRNKNYKDGFHVYYNIPISCNKRLFFFNKIRKEIENEEVFDDIEHSSSYDDIVDKCVIIDNGVMMFGSQKEGGKPYQLTSTYNSEIELEPDEDYEEYDDLINIFSLRQYNDDDDTQFKDKYSKKEEELNSAPLYIKQKKKKELKKELINNVLDKNSIKIFNPKKSFENSYALENLPEENKLTFDLVDMLSTKRATDYDTWTRVGWCLYNISSKLYNLYVYFSSKAPNFNESSCYELWSKAKNDGNGLTISTLKIWAKEDSPEVYEEKFFARQRELAMQLISPSHHDMANIIYDMYGDTFVCSNIGKNIWFEFQGHRWVGIDSAYTLQSKIATEVSKLVKTVHDYYYHKIAQEKSKTEQENLKRKADQTYNVMKKLQDQNYISTLIKTCAVKFYVPKFEETLDENPYLIGFENGILDLTPIETKNENGVVIKREIIKNPFRNGMPDDRVTFSTGYNYVELSEDDKIVKKIDSFIDKIQPLSHLKEYVLRLFASCLDGKNKDQEFRIFTGIGSNGKSKMIDLLTETLGTYAGSLPPDVLTLKNNNANGATPYLADKKGKRFLVLQEPEGDSTIQVGKMKGLSGGDKVPARGLFKDPIEYVPQFKMILVCNKLPKIPSDDGGTWRRIRVTKFNSKFVKTSKEVDHSKHHYLADLTIDPEKMKRWAPVFMWMLVNKYYKKYIDTPENEGGLQEPTEVREYTDKYRKDSDTIREFLDETIKITGNNDDKERVVLLYAQFKEWHRENHSTSFKTSKKELEEYLEEKMYLKISKGFVIGVKGVWEEINEDGN